MCELKIVNHNKPPDVFLSIGSRLAQPISSACSEDDMPHIEKMVSWLVSMKVRVPVSIQHILLESLNKKNIARLFLMKNKFPGSFVNMLVEMIVAPKVKMKVIKSCSTFFC